MGEYTALASSKIFDEQDLFFLVKQRGIYMEEAYPEGGAMAAVIGLDASKAEAICMSIGKDIFVANYNCPGQIVISGKKDVLVKVYSIFKNACAKRIIPLNVSGPFHSPLLNKASKQLGYILNTMKVNPFFVPYVTNVSAKYVYSTELVKPLLCSQVVSGVRWQQSIENMINHKIEYFIEIGPRRTLSGFNKQINATIKTINIQNVDDLKKLEGI